MGEIAFYTFVILMNIGLSIMNAYHARQNNDNRGGMVIKIICWMVSITIMTLAFYQTIELLRIVT